MFKKWLERRREKAKQAEENIKDQTEFRKRAALEKLQKETAVMTSTYCPLRGEVQSCCAGRRCIHFERGKVFSFDTGIPGETLFTNISPHCKLWNLGQK